MAYRNPPLDDSHQPFKRSSRIGTGPRGREVLKEKKIFQCTRVLNRKYEQLCVVVKDVKGKYRKGAVKIVVVDPTYKSKYNSDYNKWLKKGGRPRFRNAFQANYKYRKPLPRTTRAARRAA
jgi:hypothetical protein